MSTEGNGQSKTNERINALRFILEREQGREVSYSEAVEVGETLLSFFEVLAEGTNG
jgi:hypothetical protein